ncbi:Glutamate-1-semialdehyde 2,1-aminomutase 1 [Rosistilla oblonga]|uniref:aminotransferase class III-fold pyridoxal phosphate-dependent enzyme n=1 Tax=Rosistilla oblonga TaxID=2527990 RepID=UPI001187D8BD|nr:aminotransferase class III-fold pyridoxal phosphate-dependent enzyme [Rosistilla oblonga]QDV10929.1 Glutamate-1-semialdehyde 2,1-aminomutase 1 [Rosistilla oblonga]
MDRLDPGFTHVENTLSTLLRERTGYAIADLDRDATFMELGFDSLFLIQLSQEIKQRFSVKVSFRQLIEEVTSVDALIAHLVDQMPAPAAAPAPEMPAPVTHPAAAEPVAEPTPQPEPVATPAAPVVEAQPAAPTAPVVAAVAPPQPAAAMIPTPPQPLPATPVTPIAAPAAPVTYSGPVASVSGVEQIILQHNALMASHLAMLTGQPMPASPVMPAATIPAPQPIAAPQPASQPIAAAPAAPAPSPTAVDAGASQSCASNNGQACASDAPAAIAPAPKPVNKFERFGPYKPVRKGTNNGLTDQQQQHLNQFMDRFTRRTAKSRQHAQTHRDHFADPRGVAGYRRIWKSMVYQIAVERSKGSKLWDIDGNQYVDIAMGFGLNLFGQSPDFVTKALHEQLDRGVEVGPQSAIAGEVAQLLCDFSRKERATFCCTGSEAVMAALRLARTVTGKSKFVYFNKDYHGNFDQVLCRSSRIGDRRISSPAAPGVPQTFADNAIVLDYGTPEALQVLEQRSDEIAAVLIEPVQSADPFLQPKEFLQAIRRITREKNMAMIMDEVITGFRAAQGGAQEWFDVWADMSTYGKILGGGMPIGALAGSRKYMDALDGGTWKFEDDSEPEADMTFFAGTFVRHPLGLAAAHQVLMKLKEEGPALQRQLTDKTTRLVQTLNAFFEREQFPIRVAQFASQFRFMFPPDLEYADMLYFHMLDRGVFTRGWGDNCFLSTEHSDEDIAHVINAVQESCLEIRRGGFFPDPVAASDVCESDEKKKSIATQASSVALPAVSSPASDSWISTLVEIQPEGDRTPLFCTPAADGLTMIYHALADHLGEDQPLYGLNSPGVLGLPIADTLEEFAAGLVREIREVQPHGPYLLAGYCSGGTVALEIAQQLTAAGEQVAMLAMIETYNWLTAPSTNPTTATKLSYGRQRVEFHLRNFLLLNSQEKRLFLSSKLHSLGVRTKVWRGSIARLFSKKKPRRIGATVNMADLWRQHDAICEAYVPKPYPGRIVHFRPRRDYKCHLGAELEAVEGAEYHRMEAYPAGLMVDPFVRQLAVKIEQSIDEGLAMLQPPQSTPAPEYAAIGQQ